MESRARTSNDSGSGTSSHRDGELLFTGALADGLHQSSPNRLVETCQMSTHLTDQHVSRGGRLYRRRHGTLTKTRTVQSHLNEAWREISNATPDSASKKTTRRTWYTYWERAEGRLGQHSSRLDRKFSTVRG